MDQARMTIRLFLPLAAALALAACGSESASTDEPEIRASIEQTGNDGAMTAQIRGDNGQTIDIASDPAAPVNLPDGFTLFPGAKVTSNTSMAMGEGNAAIISFDSASSPERIVAHYRAEAEAAGIPVTAEVSAGDTRSIAGDAENGDSFQLSVEPSRAGSTATLMVGRDMGG